MASKAIPLKESRQELTRELLPAEGDDKLGYAIFEYLDEILKYKNQLGLPGKWNRNYELGKNRHFRKTSDKAPLVTANLLHAHRQRTVNQLTDNNPVFNVKQAGDVGPNQEEAFDSLLKTSDFWWQDTEQQGVLERSIINGETFGCTIEKVVFNAMLENGLGEVETLIVDPYHFGMYPVGCMMPQKSEALFHFWPMSVREARRRWDSMARHIRSDKEYLTELGDARIEVMGGKSNQPKGYFSTFSGIVKNILNLSGEGTSSKDEVLIVEVWVKDYSRIKQGDEYIDKYPGNIRCVQTCNGGEVILSDRKNPSLNWNLPLDVLSKTYLWGNYPFSLTHSVTDTANPWGMSDFEQLEQLNIEADKALSQFTMVKDKVSRIKLKNPKDTGVDNSELTNAPGIVNPTNSIVSEGLKYMDPPKLPPDLMEGINLYKDMFFLIAGTFDIDQINTPGDKVIAYKAIATLLERAATMLRGKIRNYSRMIRQRGRMYVSHVMNWYTEPRWISFESGGENKTMMILGENLRVPAKFYVVSGSTMPVSQIQEREEALGLYREGAIDVEALLDKIDWPDRKSVIIRLKEGPIGEMLHKLEALGAPPQLLEYMGHIGVMEFKEFEKALEDGEIPQFQQMLLPMEEQGPNPMDVAELDQKDAEIRKVEAEIALLQEKAMTEKVKQMVDMAGVEFDREKLVIERAKVVAEVKASDHAIKNPEPPATKTANKTRQGPYDERGMKSNNKRK